MREQLRGEFNMIQFMQARHVAGTAGGHPGFIVVAVIRPPLR